MYRVSALVIAIALAVFIMAKAFDKKDAPGNTGDKPVAAETKKEAAEPPAKTKAIMELSAGKKFDAAGSLVRSFFKNWEYSRFTEMHAQTVNSRREAFFVLCLKQTPIKWRNLEIVSEKRNGDDWDVELALEVTDITSAFAAMVVNSMVPPGNNSNHIFRFTPRSLDIERFMKVKQTWRVVTLDGKNLIDIGAKESRVERHSNIMNYVLDTGVIENAPVRGEGGWSPEVQARVNSAWLTEAIMDTNTPMDNARKIMLAAVPLVKKGINAVAEYAKALEQTGMVSEPEEAPQGIDFQ